MGVLIAALIITAAIVSYVKFERRTNQRQCPDCGFRVGATTRQWRVGEAFVFDDSIEHEAWNDSDELRVVLIIDVWPPALGQAERQAVAAVIGSTDPNLIPTQ